tara:strand:+ start:569 stop:1984 length:1416 start_codon:yes stop_codon:yes gene_type:complete
MVVWFALGAMVVVSVFLLGRPLIRTKGTVPLRPDYDLVVYREQLKDVELDYKRGVLSESDYKNSCTEIERRILAAGSNRDLLSHGQNPSSPQFRGSLIILCVTVPMLTGFIYYQLGSPLMADQPFVERVASEDDGIGASEFDNAVASLTSRLVDNPEDLEGWILLARTYAFMERFSDAVSAYREAAVLAPNNVDVLMSLAQAIVVSQKGRVTPSARGEFERVLRLDPKNKIARFFVGLEREQAGDLERAYDVWSDLASDSNSEDIWLPELRTRLQALAQKLELSTNTEITGDTAEPLNEEEEGRAVTAAPGPTREQVEAAGQMTADERGEMIRGMVERLATRLETAPDDIEGWKRLGNARRVLGELTEAEAAYGRALDLSPSDVVALEAQAQIALERSGDGSVPKITQMNYQKILELDNERMDALWYLGLAAYQESRTDEARTLWETLLNLLPPDSPNAREVKRRLGELGG